MAIPTCRDMSELATPHMERALPMKAEAQVRLHLLLCPACRRYLAQMRATVRLLAGGRLRPPPSRVEQDVLTRLATRGYSNT